MKPYHSLISKLLKTLLVFLGFSAAFSLTVGQEKKIVVAYGTPSTLYKFRGEIVDEDTGKPIEGLRVVLYREETFINNKVSETRLAGADTAFTNVRGRFSVELLPKRYGGKTLLKIEDIDGMKNGNYPDSLVYIDFRNVESKPNREPTLSRTIAEKDIGLITLTEEKD